MTTAKKNIHLILLCLSIFLVQLPTKVQAFGVITHYLPASNIAQQSIADFDVDQLVSSLVKIKAEYYVFTLGQNNGQFNSYNPILEKFCPSYETRQPKRSLVKDLAKKLKSKNIKLFLYLPFRSPQSDLKMRECLDDTPELSPTKSEFIKKWAEVINYWSEELNGDLSGWWFDGAYNLTAMSSSDWRYMCDAAFAGNSRRLVAFNSGEGIKQYDKVNAPCQTMMAGEMNRPLNDADEFKQNDGLRFHVISPLGSKWSSADIVYTKSQFKKLVNIVNELHGLLTIDIKMIAPGVVDKNQEDFLLNYSNK